MDYGTFTEKSKFDSTHTKREHCHLENGLRFFGSGISIVATPAAMLGVNGAIEINVVACSGNYSGNSPSM